jgi:hypothetical protein
MSSFFINNHYSEEPLIFTCAKNKNYYMIEFLLKNGVDINTKFGDEHLLTLLVKNNCITHFILRYIKKYNANINIYDNNNNHLLFLLLKNYTYYYSVIQYIIYEKNQDLDNNLKNDCGSPLILCLLEVGFIDTVMHMIHNLSYTLNTHLINGDPIIFKLLREKKFNIANILFSSKNIDIYSKNKFTHLSLFEFLVVENLYTFIKHILDNYNFIIPYKIINNYSLIEVAAKNNNTLILNKLILYECAKKIQTIFRGWSIRKIGSFN